MKQRGKKQLNRAEESSSPAYCFKTGGKILVYEELPSIVLTSVSDVGFLLNAAGTYCSKLINALEILDIEVFANRQRNGPFIHINISFLTILRQMRCM